MEHSLPLSLSFIDLRNAFGSILHVYISDILLSLWNFPLSSQTTRTICIHCSLLTSLLKTGKCKPWLSLKEFFKGIHYPPSVFDCLQSYIPSVTVHPSKGFVFRLLTKDNQPAFPCPNSYVYMLWEEKGSMEVPGWYLAKVQSVNELGETWLQ